MKGDHSGAHPRIGLRILAWSIIALVYEALVLFALCFQPGWAAGWPGVFEAHSCRRCHIRTSLPGVSHACYGLPRPDGRLSELEIKIKTKAFRVRFPRDRVDFDITDHSGIFGAFFIRCVIPSLESGPDREIRRGSADTALAASRCQTLFLVYSL